MQGFDDLQVSRNLIQGLLQGSQGLQGSRGLQGISQGQMGRGGLEGKSLALQLPQILLKQHSQKISPLNCFTAQDCNSFLQSN